MPWKSINQSKGCNLILGDEKSSQTRIYIFVPTVFDVLINQAGHLNGKKLFASFY